MDAATYKHICEQPDVLSRNILEATMREIARDLRSREHPASGFESNIAVETRRERDLMARTLLAKLNAILESQAIPKPDKHSVGAATDYFKVRISAEELDAIIDLFESAEAAAVMEGNGETTAEASRLASLVDVWTAVGGDGSEPTAG